MKRKRRQSDGNEVKDENDEIKDSKRHADGSGDEDAPRPVPPSRRGSAGGPSPSSRSPFEQGEKVLAFHGELLYQAKVSRGPSSLR